MKAGTGSLAFLLLAGMLLGSALAGGQVWAMTGSIDGGIAAGVGVGVTLGVGARMLYARAGRPRRKQIFAATEELRDGGFVEIRDPLDDAPRAAVATQARHRPGRVAGTVRSMMARNKPIRRR